MLFSIQMLYEKIREDMRLQSHHLAVFRFYRPFECGLSTSKHIHRARIPQDADSPLSNCARWQGLGRRSSVLKPAFANPPIGIC